MEYGWGSILPLSLYCSVGVAFLCDLHVIGRCLLSAVKILMLESYNHCDLLLGEPSTTLVL